jgi:putative ABC transport system permease protein
MSRGTWVAKNVLRNGRRSLLTAASVAVSILLLSIFCATYRYLESPPVPPSFAMILIVSPRTSIMIPLPLSYGDRIARMPGVETISPINMVDSFYGPQQALQFVLAFDAAKTSTLVPGWVMPADQRQAFQRERMATAVGRSVAAKFGWKLGDRVHLRSPGYNLTLELVVRGIYTSADDESLMGMHWEYLNQLRGSTDKPGGFWVRARTLDDVPRLMKAIDAEFRNEPTDTRTQSMAQFILDFIAMLGNVKLMLMGVSAVVVFSVLLILANTMAMSIRERTVELAVLRALGFRHLQILGMLTAESLVITFAGGLAGFAIAMAIFKWVSGYRIGGAMPTYVQADVSTALLVFGVALGISLASTLPSAYHGVAQETRHPSVRKRPRVRRAHADMKLQMKMKLLRFPGQINAGLDTNPSERQQ